MHITLVTGVNGDTTSPRSSPGHAQTQADAQHEPNNVYAIHLKVHTSHSPYISFDSLSAFIPLFLSYDGAEHKLIEFMVKEDIIKGHWKALEYNWCSCGCIRCMCCKNIGIFYIFYQLCADIRRA